MTERRVLVLLVALGAGLRLLRIGSESFWGDELAMALVTGRGWDAAVDELLRGRAPVFPVLGHLWMQLVGTSEAAARSLSALAGGAALPLLFLVGRRLLPTRAALVAVALMAVSEFQIAYAQEYRYYALVVLLTIVTMLTYLRFVEGGRAADGLGWCVSAGALFHTHPYGLLVVAAQDAHFWLVARDRPALRRPFALAHLVLALILLPGLVLRQAGTFVGHQRIPSWIPEPAPWQPVVTLVHFLLPRGTSVPAVAALGVLFLGAAALSARRGRLAWISPGRERALLLVLWATLPLLVPLVSSWLFTPIYVDRYVIAASPACYLLAGLGLTAIRAAVPLPASVGALLLVIAPGLFGYYTTPQKEQWREAAAYVRSVARPGDVLVLVEPRERQQSRAFGWYGAGAARVCSVDRELANPQALWADFAACLPATGRAFVFERAPAPAVLRRWIEGPAPVLRSKSVGRFLGIVVREVERVTRESPGS